MFKAIRKKLIMIRESTAMALDNIRSNKVRSFLTLLGIMIGITAVIALISTVSGVSGSIASSFADMGVGTLTLNVTGNDLKSGLTADDLKTLSDLKSVDGLVPNVSMTTRVSCRGTVKTDVSVAGRNAYYALLNEDMITQGRALNFIDDDNYSFVCVISQTMVDTFFFGVNPIGETLYVAGLPFTVAGRYEEDSGGGIAAIFSGKPDVIIPYTTALKIGGTGETNNLTVHMAAGVNSEDAKKELEECLDPLFGFEEDCYTITSMESIEETMQTMMGMMSTLLAGIASIALVVGGIGIMNMMLTTVTERTVEIGLKKALGAMPWQIQLQFLIESFMLSLLGGLAGVLTGLLLSYALCQVIGTQFVISGGAIALGVGFSAAVGILFGWAPARKASRLNPIDALRSI